MLMGLGCESDYEATKKEKEGTRELRKSRGYSASDTEEEDEEEDATLKDEVDAEDADDHPVSKTQRKTKKAARISKATSNNDKGDGKAKAPLKPGPLTSEAKEAAVEFGEEVLQAAEKLADIHCTSRLNILVAAGLAIRESRAPNKANQHARWYAFHHPKASGGMYFYIQVIQLRAYPDF